MSAFRTVSICGAILGLFALLGADTAAAQAAAEYAGAISKTGSGGSLLRRVELPKQPPQADKSPFLHLPAGATQAFAEANRRGFEAQAGPDAGKLVLRAVPKLAQVWVNGKFVGSTPVDLTVAPGGYTVEMRAAMSAPTVQKVDVAPRQNREVNLALKPRYPSQVQLR